MSNTQVTVGQCRRLFSSLVGISDDGTDTFLQVLNLGMDNIFNRGKWKGALTYLMVQPTLNLLGTLSNGSFGYITLPRRYLGVLGTRFGCVPSPTFSQWHTFVDSGPGFICPERPTLGILVDDGDGYPSQRLIPPGLYGTLSIVTTNAADAGQPVRIFGLANDATQVYDSLGEGFNITTGFPNSQPCNQLVSLLQAVQGPMSTEAPPVYFKGNWQLWFTPKGTNIPGQTVPTAPMQLGQYEPTEQIPSYRKYTCGNLSNVPSGDPWAISILAQRRFVELINDSDPVTPGSLNAIRYAILGGNHDLALRYDKAETAYSLAEARLNEMTRLARAGARVDAEMANALSTGWGAQGWGGSGAFSPNAF